MLSQDLDENSFTSQDWVKQKIRNFFFQQFFLAGTGGVSDIALYLSSC